MKEAQALAGAEAGEATSNAQVRQMWDCRADATCVANLLHLDNIVLIFFLGVPH